MQQRTGLIAFWKGYDRKLYLKAAILADRLGYDSFWLPEVWGYESFQLLTEIAIHTKRIKLGTGIINVFSRSPALIAMSVATLDEISEGRVILGIGTSGKRVIEGFHAREFKQPLTQTRDVIRVTRALLDGTPLFDIKPYVPYTDAHPGAGVEPHPVADHVPADGAVGVDGGEAVETVAVHVVRRVDDPEFVTTFLAMEAWAADNVPFPGELYRQYIKDCYQGNLLCQGRMLVGGQRVDLGQIRANLLNVIADQVGAPTGADLLADMTALALPRLRAEAALGGTYHCAAGGETSWHGYTQFVIEWARAHGQAIKVAPDRIAAIPTSAYPTPAQRPLNSRLDTTKLQTTFGLQLPHWQTGVARMLAEIL